MSAEASIELIAEKGLRESLEEICASQQDFRRFFAGTFDELDALCKELLQDQQAWLTERAKTESDLQERAARLEAEYTELATQRQQMAEGDESQPGQVGRAEAGNSGQLHRLLEEANQERVALRNALEGAQAQADRLAQMADKVSGASTELAEAREEIHRLRDQLEKAHAKSTPSQPDGKLLEQVQRIEHERAELEQERAVLETELETVRNRAAEMAETLAEQRRQSTEERTQWAQELKRMRRMLEMLSAHRFEHQAAPGFEPAGAELRAEPASAPAAQGDPVLDSVMAQFEMLQKDLARRRKATAARS